MPKLHFTEAPEAQRRRIESELLVDQRRAINLAYALGYVVRATDLRTPALDRLREIEASSTRPVVARYQAEASVQIANERACLSYIQSLSRWAAGPPISEVIAEQQKQHAAAQREIAVTERTRAILVAEAAKREQAARARAEKELAQ